MIRHNFVRFTIIYTALFIMLSKAQQLGPVEKSNGSIPLDPFLDDDEFEKDYSFIVSFKFHLKEEMLPQIFTEIAMQNMPCSFQNCIISLIDIAEATQISTFSSDVIAEAIGALHINPSNLYSLPLTYNITTEVVENLLQKFDLTFSLIYKKFLDSLSNPIQTIPNILNTLNVSVLDFMNAVTYGNDTVQLQVLSTGNYSQENVNAVLNITNKSSTDMLKSLPFDEIVKQLRKVDANEFTKLVEVLGVTTTNMLDFYQYLNITPINFLSYPSFIHIVSDFYDSLNTEEALGVIVSKNKVVTSNKAVVLATYQNQDTEIIKSYVTFHAELVENPLMQFVVQNLTLRNSEYQSQQIGYVGLKDAVATEFVEISRDYNKTTLTNCTYVTKLPFGGLYPENMNSSQIYLENNKLVITKTENTLYNLGSPLFCQDKLYGIATEDDVKQIKFSTFMKRIPGMSTTSTTVSVPVGGSGEGSSENASSTSLCYNLFNIVLGLTVLKFIL